MDLVRILKPFDKLNAYNERMMCEVRLQIPTTKTYSLLRNKYLCSKSELMWFRKLQ